MSRAVRRLGRHLARRIQRQPRRGSLRPPARLAGTRPGLRLPARDFTNNDLNLSNILSDGQHITGIVDWDEFRLGSRAIDLVVLAFDCAREGTGEMADRLLARAREAAVAAQPSRS